MGSITDIKSALTQRALQIFCETYHVSDEVHPQLPNSNQTIHEMPTSKIGVYTRLFEYANFRLPLSTSLVDVLRYYHIHISQLSVIGAVKVSHFEVLCRVHGFEPTVGLFRYFYLNSKNKGWMSFSKRPGNDAICYTKPLDSLKNWNDYFFWVDSFACSASFPWSTSKGVPKDPFPKSSEFNAEHYAILVAHPALFHKYPELFLCLVGINRYYTLDVDTYPEFLRDGDEEMDLLSFIRTADPMKVRVGERQRADGEPQILETTVGRVVPILPVAPARTSGELEASVERLFGEGDGGEQVEQGDFAGGGQGVDIQPVITAADTIVKDVALLQPMRRKKRKTVVVDASGPSHPPKKLKKDYGDPSGPSIAGKPRSARENENPVDSVTGPNLRTISAPQRFVIFSDSSHHFGANIAEAEVDSIVRSSTPIIATVVTATVDAAATAKETPVRPSLFGVGSSSAGGTDPTPGGFSDVSGSDFLIGGIRTVVEPDFDLQKVYVPQWSVTNGSRLDDSHVCCEMLDEFAPPKFFASIRGMEHDQLFTEFNVGAARHISLSAEVRMRAEYNIKEKRKLRAVVEEKDILLKAKGEEVDSLKAQLLVKEAKAAEPSVSVLKLLNLAATIKVREQEAADSDAMVTAVHALEVTCSSLRDQISTYEQVDLSEMTLHFEEKFYPHLLTTIAGRRWLLTHGLKLFLTKCLNSSEYLSALGATITLFIGISLLAELKSHKDASVETIMNLLRLEIPLVDAPGMSDLQPDVDQFMVPIHQSEDQAFLGSTSLLFALSVSRDRVERIKKNITEHRSALTGVYLNDYIIVDEENEENVQLNIEEEKQGKGEGSVVSMVEVEFEKEELGTTP
ncbi:hypothetical protein Tco_1189714 [Tanacetum coccineum]